MTRLKFWRLQRDLTQQEVARRSGLGLSAYSLIESGRLAPSSPQSKSLEQLFGVPILELLAAVPHDICPLLEATSL